jgi:PST family polysaccharide transporter
MNFIKKIVNTAEKKILLENYLSLLFLQGANFILPLLTLPYLVRVLGTEKFGLVMFAQAFIVFFNIIVDFGFNLSATREISVHRDNKEKVTEIFSAVMTIKFILFIISFFILTLTILIFDKFSQDITLYLFTFLIVFGQMLFPVWYFQGMEKMKLVTIVNVISKIIFTVLVFIVIQEKDDYIYVPIINGVGFIFGGVLSLIILYIVFKQKFKISSFDSLKYYFVDSSQYFLSRISVTLYTSSNAFILGLFTSNTMVGYYAIAEKLYQALQQMYQPIIQTLYPYISKSNNVKLFKKVFTISIVLNALGIIFLYLYATNIFELLFSKNVSAQSLEVFYIFLLASLIVVPSVFLGYPFLGALGFPKYANMSVVYGSIFHMVGLALLAMLQNVSIYSVATLVVVTEIVVFVLRGYWVKKENLW